MIPNNLENAIYGLVSTPALHLADRHGMFRQLINGGPATAAALAEGSGVDPDTTERLLLVLVAFGVLERDNGGRYAIPVPVVPYLDAGDPRYVGGFVEHLISHTPTRVPKLEQFLARGKEAVDAEQPKPFETFYRDEAATAAFMDAMWNLSFDVSRELAELAAFDEGTTLVDVGGASGPFAVASLLHLPTLRATVFDLPEVEPYLRKNGEHYGVADRLSFVAGDFFADELPEGEAISFGYVLSDWTDEDCVSLLRKAHRACRPGGQVMVMERLFDDDRSGPLATAVMNLEMHVETQGRHRTAEEYVGLLSEAGFINCRVARSSREKHLIAGRA
jgi:hypothetical protein